MGKLEREKRFSPTRPTSLCCFKLSRRSLFQGDAVIIHTTATFKTCLLVTCVLAIGVGGLVVPVVGQTGAIRGVVYDDANANGVQDAGELLLDGWEVQLFDASGPVGTQITGTSGAYQFGGLPAGPYVVHQVVQPGWTQTSPGFETEFTAGDVTNTNWGYTDPTKVLPPSWPTVAPDAAGNFQSPVNVPSAAARNLDDILEIHYLPTVTDKIFNNGHTIEVQYAASPNNRIEIGGQEFELEQFHFHTTSEHTIDGVNADMELHLVHQHHDGGLAVVGVLLDAVPGADNPAFATVFDNLPNLETKDDEVTQPTAINANSLLPKDKTGFFYEGSLTTPPASEPVNWFLFDTPVQISESQLAAYQAVGDLNDFNPGNRPLQLLNGRQFNELNQEVTLGNGESLAVNFGNVIPEPATLGVLVIGGLALMRRCQVGSPS